MKTQAEFNSSLFPAYNGEEEEINPGRFGKRLAEFMAERLRAHGLETDEPYAEDWGWAVEIRGLKVPFLACCGNVDGETERFLVFLDPDQPILKKFLRKVDISDDLARVSAALEQVVTSEPGISQIEWTET